MPGTPPTGTVAATIDPARGGRVSLGRVALDFPAGATEGRSLMTVSLTVRDRLPESPYRRLHVVFDVEATEPMPLNARKETTRKAGPFRKPVSIEVDLAGMGGPLPRPSWPGTPAWGTGGGCPPP